MKITTKTLARKLGMAQSTISMALSNHPAIRLKTRERVQARAREFGYIPNQISRAMRLQKTNTIGIIVFDLGISFFQSMIRALEIEARAREHQILLYQFHGSSQLLEKGADFLRGYRVEGLIIMPVNHVAQADFYQRLLKQSFPFVLLGEEVQGVKAHAVRNDDVTAGFLATEHLLRLGHRRIACVRGHPDTSTALQRFEGYRRALRRHGVKVDEKLVVGENFGFEDGHQAVERLLARKVRFTALMAAADMSAVGAMKALQARGLRIPEDTAIVGCGNLDFAPLVTPSLTTIDQKPVEQGRAAVRLLLDHVVAGRRAIKRVAIQPALIVRESCGANKSR